MYFLPQIYYLAMRFTTCLLILNPKNCISISFIPIILINVLSLNTFDLINHIDWSVIAEFDNPHVGRLVSSFFT